MKSQVFKQVLFFSITAILGPILLFGGIGYMLDRYFATNKLFLFLGIGLAFITTHIYMFRKVKEFSKISSSLDKKNEVKDSNVSLKQESK